jgi:translation initiation factor IF-1
VARDDQIELDGVIDQVAGAGFFKVRVPDPKKPGENLMVTAVLCGKMKQHKIRVVLGDVVKVAVSPYDLTRGRITRRDRGQTT